MTSPRLANAARRAADHQKAQARELPPHRPVLATVATVTAGAAGDGNALVTVTWMGATVTCSGYVNTYTPQPTDRVVCLYIGNQLIVVGKVIGHP